MTTSSGQALTVGRVSVFLKAASVMLGILACVYLTKGLNGLVLDPRGAIDLNQRFQEVHLFWGLPISEADRVARLDASFTLTRWDMLNYLPSTHVLGLLFTPPIGWSALRVYYALLNVGLVGLTVVALFRLAQPAALPAWTFFPCLVASSSICSALGNGQYGIVVVSMLTCAVLAATSGRTALAVILLTLATVKPVLCIPFFFALLFYRQWKLVGGPALIAGAILAISFWHSADPLLVHFEHYRSTSQLTMTRGFGLNDVLLQIGLPTRIFSLLDLAAAVASLGGLTWLRPGLWKERPLVFLGLACFVGRAWFPLTEYDNVMLLPMLAAAVVEGRRRRSALAMGLAILMGVSLWLPARWIANPGGAIFQWCAWLVVAGFLIRESRVVPAEALREGAGAEPAVSLNS